MDSSYFGQWAARGLAACVFAAFGLWAWRRFNSNVEWKKNVGSGLIESVRRRAGPFVLVAAATVLFAILVPFAQMGEDASTFLQSVLDVWWLVLAAWAGTVLVGVFSDAARRRFDISVEDNFQARRVHTKIVVLQKVVLILIWLSAAAGILMLFERFRTLGGTLLASAGVVSIILGFSAQKTFGAIAAGIHVALSHPINLDDVVVVEGEWGRIEEITFTYVIVKTWDLRRLVVPVTYFLETPFQNWTRKSSEIIGSVFIHTDYTIPVEPVREELRRLCVDLQDLWDGKTCVLQVTDTGPESITLRALVSASNASKLWDLRCLVREGLIEFMRRHYPESLPRRRLDFIPSDTLPDNIET